MYTTDISTGSLKSVLNLELNTAGRAPVALSPMYKNVCPKIF